MTKRVFRIRKNRLCVWIRGVGPVVSATDGDDVPVFETERPKLFGDHAIVRVEGKRRRVRLMPSEGGRPWLVDMGPA